MNGFDMRRLTTVFLGTPEFAVPVLDMLAESTRLALVITQPDRPSGRGRKMAPPPVMVRARELGVEAVQPEIVKGAKFTQFVSGYQPDVIVTAAFGRLLGAGLLSLPGYGCLNVHASILPRYRGAAPINHAILNGETRTGVSIMRMVAELDAGPVFRVGELDIGDDETAGELTVRLATMGAVTLRDVLARLDELVPVPQDTAAATFAPPICKEDGRIDWHRGAEQIARQVRGLHPWPCAFTFWNGAPLKVHTARAESGAGDHAPGTVIFHAADGIRVACGSGVLVLRDVQMPGKKRLTPAQFFSGVRLSSGSFLG